jgi:hypothetical protein
MSLGRLSPAILIERNGRNLSPVRPFSRNSNATTFT